MSLFGAMNSAISGLSAQSNAFGNISDNVANSQTVGFKRVDTSFIDYLTTSTSQDNSPGAVVARPAYENTVQGTINQSDNPTAMAIAGQGFFAVSQIIGQQNNAVTFNPQQYYTRAGDFQMDKNGYLVNSAGEVLNGWPVNASTGAVNQNQLSPVRVTQTVYNPVPTAEVTLSANLPATPSVDTTATPLTSDIDIYDALGTLHTVTLQWSKDASTPNLWHVSISIPDDTVNPPPAVIGPADVTFGANGTAAGTIGDVTSSDPNVTYSSFANGTPSYITFPANFASGSQTIKLNLGTYGSSDGVTQYAGTDYNLRGLTQNGVPPGAFAGIATQANGNIVVNYDNGQTRTIAQVPLVTFNAPDALQRQNGQSFTATTDSGTPLANAASTNGAGNLVTSSVETSNVDIATEFSKLIVAQQAYTASAKMVTTAQALLQTTIDMKQ